MMSNLYDLAVKLFCEKHSNTSIKYMGERLVLRSEMVAKSVWLSSHRGSKEHFEISLPKQTQYDDGDRQRNERHAVTDGVPYFDSSEEFPL